MSNNPKEFKENATTVREAIEALKKLDPDTPVRCEMEHSVDIVLFNHKYTNEHVSFEGGGLWTSS